MGTKCTLNPLALGLACGILWGISVLLMGLAASYIDYGKVFVDAVGALYVGYEPSVMGSLIGGLIGFVDAFLGGFILGWLYNKLDGCCCKKASACCPAQQESTKGKSDTQ